MWRDPSEEAVRASFDTVYRSFMVDCLEASRAYGIPDADVDVFSCGGPVLVAFHALWAAKKATPRRQKILSELLDKSALISVEFMEKDAYAPVKPLSDEQKRNLFRLLRLGFAEREHLYLGELLEDFKWIVWHVEQGKTPTVLYRNLSLGFSSQYFRKPQMRAREAGYWVSVTLPVAVMITKIYQIRGP